MKGKLLQGCYCARTIPTLKISLAYLAAGFVPQLGTGAAMLDEADCQPHTHGHDGKLKRRLDGIDWLQRL